MARLTLSFLDTFQVMLERQPITHFRSANNQGLLAYLALHNEKPLAREVLAAVFWPDESEQNARNNLRQSLYQLRKLLGDLDEPVQPYLLVTRQTVQFNPDSDFELDVQEFLRAVDDGDLETAVSHYHGDLLPGFTCDSLEFEAWLRQERETVHQLALETMFELTRDCLRNGRYPQAQTIAHQQLSLEPWREQAHRQLMQALALAGDRGNALAQYETCREALAEELGIEPADETVKLVEDIKAGRYGSAAATDIVRPPVRVRHNLPADITPLIGRELERAQISHLFIEEKQRFVTIIGPGGMGKTRLSIAIGSEMLPHFQAGVYFVDLTPLNQPEEIPQAIASVLDYRAPDKAQDLFPQLLTTLSRQDLFFILDNFEHLLAGATLVQEILQTCPQITILVTSRQRLNLASESRFELGGLDFPDWLTPEDALDYTAVQLFMENGRRAQPEFTLTAENVDAVTRICQLVQGMPLGLVLAASWLALLSPSEIAAEIEKSLDFLAADLTDLPLRQRSMQAVFDYSWQTLTPDEQVVLAKLSVFRGGFTREAAEKVAGANLRVLLALVNKSLLQRQVENGRFAMHELLRQFATEQRRQLDPHDDTLSAHCRYFAQLALAEARWALPFGPIHLPRKYLADRDNFRRAWAYALAHGLAAELSGMAQGMMQFSYAQGGIGIQPTAIITEAIQSLQQQGVPETDKAILRLRLVEIEVIQSVGDRSKLDEKFLAFLPLVEKHGDPELHCMTYGELYGIEAAWQEQVIEHWVELARQAIREMGNERLSNAFELYELWLRTFDQPPDRVVLDRAQQLMVYFEPEYADSFIFYVVLQLLHHQYRGMGAFDKAVQAGKRALNLAKQWHDLYWIGNGAGDLADTYIEMGLHHEVRKMLLDDFEWHQTGQTWQMLGYLWARSVYRTEWIGGQETAVSLLSLVFHHPEAPINYRQQIEEALTQFEAEMETAAFAAAWAKGRTLDLDTAVSQVRLALMSVGE